MPVGFLWCVCGASQDLSDQDKCSVRVFIKIAGAVDIRKTRSAGRMVKSSVKDCTEDFETSVTALSLSEKRKHSDRDLGMTFGK